MSNIIAWACDFSSDTGEGKLARDFVDRLSQLQKVNFLIYSPASFSVKIYNQKIVDKKIRKKSNSAFLHRFIFPISGILFLIFNFYLKRKKIAYINYCPLWNILIFSLLPKNCILGPVTGSNTFYHGNYVSILKLILVKPLYKISLIFIKIKKKSIILCTDILVDVFNKENYINFCENYIFLILFKNFFFFNSKYKKNIDLLIYYRIHYNKDNFFFLEIIKRLSKDFNIHIFGDIFYYPNVINHGRLGQNKVYALLKRAKFTLASSENVLSLFSVEALKFNVQIFYNILLKKNLFDQIKNFHPIDFSNPDKSSIVISREIKEYKYQCNKKFLLHNIYNQKKIELFLSFL